MSRSAAALTEEPAEFLARYPAYVTTGRLDRLRATEYAYLDQLGHVYLDYAGSGLAAHASLRPGLRK
jgi:hypothetical protein